LNKIIANLDTGASKNDLPDAGRQLLKNIWRNPFLNVPAVMQINRKGKQIKERGFPCSAI